jgi:hypothetical protein
MHILLRLLVIAAAAFVLWYFSDALPLALETLADPREAQWFNVLSALAEGVFGPALAIAAIVLAVVGRRLLLAAGLVGLAVLAYLAPVIAFLIVIAIYGF